MPELKDKSQDVAENLQAMISIGGHNISLQIDLVGILLVLITLLALWIAWYHLSTVALGTRANILLLLDQRWENEPILSIRAELDTIVADVRNEANRRWPGLTEEQRREKSIEIYAGKLQQLRTGNRPVYLKLFRVCGFFETVGYVANAKYIPAQDVINLLGGSILDAGMVFKPHIDKLINEEGADKRQYEWFLWLYKETKKTATKKTATKKKET